MTTTEKLREALQTVEPGWQPVDVEAVRTQARRVRLRQRIAGVVTVVAVTVTIVSVGPVALRHGDSAGPATASLGDGVPVPTTVAEARKVTRFTPRTGPLPPVTTAGKAVAIPRVSGWVLRLMPPAGRDRGAGRVCVVGVADVCRQLERSSEGFAVQDPGSAGNIGALQAAAYWIVEAPVATVVATVEGRPAAVDLRDLGQGYQLVSVRLPVTAEGRNGMAVPDPEAVWVFDPRGHLVARHRA
jgi:hypothetical protein